MTDKTNDSPELPHPSQLPDFTCNHEGAERSITISQCDDKKNLCYEVTNGDLNQRRIAWRVNYVAYNKITKEIEKGQIPGKNKPPWELDWGKYKKLPWPKDTYNTVLVSICTAKHI